MPQPCCHTQRRADRLATPTAHGCSSPVTAMPLAARLLAVRSVPLSVCLLASAVALVALLFAADRLFALHDGQKALLTLSVVATCATWSQNLRWSFSTKNRRRSWGELYFLFFNECASRDFPLTVAILNSMGALPCPARPQYPARRPCPARRLL